MVADSSKTFMLSSLSCLEQQHSHLHTTAFFNNRRYPAQRAYDYASLSAVQDALGSVTTLTIIAWTITPRTVTARVKLASHQLPLWGNFNSLDLEEGSGDTFNKTLFTVSEDRYMY